MDKFTQFLRRLFAKPLWSSGIIIVVVATGIMTAVTYQTLTGGGQSVTVNPTNPGNVARLYFTDAVSGYSANNAASPVLMLDNGGAVVSSVDVTVHYDPALVSSAQISFEQSNCATVQTQSINTQTGSIHIVCSRFNGTKAVQLEPLAVFNVVANGLESPVFQFDTSSSVTSTNATNILGSTQPFVMTLNSLKDEAVPLVSIASSTPISSCTNDATVSFSWLRAINVTKFIYSWSADPTVTPSVSTISTNITVPMNMGTTGIFSIQAVADNGTVGAVRSIRVARCG